MSSIGDLQSKVSEKFAEIQARYPEKMQCGLGCHQCCKPDLSISFVEAQRIQEFLRDNPEKTQEIRALKNPHKGKRCGFLAANGACTIYEVRPVICRSHGAPIQFVDPEARKAEGAVRFRDVCPLNFTQDSLKDIPAQNIINLDTVNTLLALLNAQKFGKRAERVPLELDAILLARFSSPEPS